MLFILENFFLFIRIFFFYEGVRIYNEKVSIKDPLVSVIKNIKL